MLDLMRWGSDWLEEQRNALMARPVTYVRGNQSIDLPASIGRTIFRLDKGSGATERYEARDYLILSRDLILGGTPTLPLRGDRIREAAGNRIFVYEVLAPGNEPHFKYSDGYRKTLRVHTKLVATETA